jgi:hypothetical protein
LDLIRFQKIFPELNASKQYYKLTTNNPNKVSILLTINYFFVLLPYITQ